MKLSKLSLILLSTAFVAACGGGGSDETTASTASKAEGFYSGTFSTTGFPNGVFQTIILDNDQIWGLYGTQSASSGYTVYGMIQGSGSSKNGSYSSRDIKDFYYTGTTDSGTLSASYQQGVSLNGSISANGQSASFAASTPTNSTYDYNAPAKLTDITGPWVGTSLNGTPSSFTISSDGTFSINDSGCVTLAKVTPRSSKNVFDVTATNSTSTACGRSAGQTASGIVVNSRLANGARQLIALVVDSSRTAGTAFIATR
jgi:hypothetical protein